MSRSQHSFHHRKNWTIGDTMVHRLSVQGQASYDEVLQEIAEHGHDFSVGDLQFSGQITWTAPATQEDFDKRAESARQAEARTEEYERKTLARLIEKFGVPVESAASSDSPA